MNPSKSGEAELNQPLFTPAVTMTGATSGEGDPGMSAAALSIFRSDCCCCCGHGVPVDLLIQYAREIPKVELHVHLEGTLEWELALEIGKRNNISLVDTCGRASASVAEVTSIVKGDDCSQESNAVCAKRGNDFRDLDSFLCEYMKREKVLRGREDFREVALTYLEAAHKDNVRHVEFFFDLQSHTKRLAAADVIEVTTFFSSVFACIPEMWQRRPDSPSRRNRTQRAYGPGSGVTHFHVYTITRGVIHTEVVSTKARRVHSVSAAIISKLSIGYLLTLGSVALPVFSGG